MNSGYVHISSGGFGQNTEITVNGEKLRGVTKVTWEIEAHGRARATLELHATIDADALEFEVTREAPGEN